MEAEAEDAEVEGAEAADAAALPLPSALGGNADNIPCFYDGERLIEGNDVVWPT